MEHDHQTTLTTYTLDKFLLDPDSLNSFTKNTMWWRNVGFPHCDKYKIHYGASKTYEYVIFDNFLPP